MSDEFSKVIDAVSISLVADVASAPAVAMGNLYQTMSFSTGIAAMNLVFAQYQSFMAHNVASLKDVDEILQ